MASTKAYARGQWHVWLYKRQPDQLLVVSSIGGVTTPMLKIPRCLIVYIITVAVSSISFIHLTWLTLYHHSHRQHFSVSRGLLPRNWKMRRLSYPLCSSLWCLSALCRGVRPSISWTCPPPPGHLRHVMDKRGLLMTQAGALPFV